jgi:superfamily II DNA or RNA helicase
MHIYDRKIQFRIKSRMFDKQKSSDEIELEHNSRNKEFNYLFVVDIFNEGVDI